MSLSDSIGALSEDSSSESDADSNTEVQASNLGTSILEMWSKREEKLNHDVAIVAWALCVSKQVRNDVKNRMTSDHRDAIERYLDRLFQHPCPFKLTGIDETDMAAIKTKFWEEFKHFQNETGPFDRMQWWNSPYVHQGKSYLWHEMFSIHYTVILGICGCRSTSKCLGIGSGERAWKASKRLKKDRPAVGGETLEKVSILYHTARINDARIEAKEKEQAKQDNSHTYIDTTFGDDDLK